MKESAYDFYAYWNGEAVADLWTVIAAMTATDDYRVLLTAVILIGFLGALLTAALKNRGTDAITWFATTLVVMSIAFVPRVTVSVKDVRAGYTQAIQNVPIGIAWPASLTSRISWWLTQTFETAFNDVDAARYSRFGVAFPQRAVTAVMGMGAVTESGQAAVRAVAERCIIPEILDNSAKRQALLKAADINALIASDGWVNPARRVVLDGNVMTCKDAIPQLASLLETTEIPEMEKVLVAKLDVSGSDLTAAGLLAALPGAEERMLGVSRTLSQSLKQSVMLSALPDAMLSSAAKAGKAPLTTGVAIARAQGNLASEINYRALSDMAKSALPKVRNVLEFVVIALCPIVFILMAGMGMAGMTIARSYLTLLISVGLWAPITAIINYLTIHVDAEPINRLVEASGGVTLAAATLIREAGASSQAMAGSLMWLVPVLAYAVAKGSDMAVTQMASSVLAPASSAAQAQGSSIAMGNVSAGNASVGNVSANNANANKTDLSSSYTAPEKHASSTAFGAYQGSMATGRVTAMSVARTDLGIDSSGSYSRSVENARTESNSSADAFSHGTMRSDSTAHTSGDTVVGMRGSTVTAGESTVHSDGTNYATTVNYSTADSVGNSTNMTRSGNSTETIGMNSGAGWMLSSAYKDNPEYAGKTTSVVENSAGIIDLSSFSLMPTGAPSTPNLVAGSAPRPQTSSSPANNKMHSATDLFNLGNRFSVNTQAGLTDTATMGLMTQSNTTLAVSDTNGEVHSGIDQQSIQTSEQAAVNHQQSSNLATTKSDGTRSEKSESQETRSGKNYSDSHGASTRTGIDMSVLTRDESLRVFGSPVAALEALSTSVEQRVSFGRHVKSLADNENLTADFRSDVNNDGPRSPLASRNLSTEHSADGVGIKAAGDYSFGKVNEESAVKPGEVRVFRIPAEEKEQDDFFWNRGLQIASTANYQDEETGLGSVTARSYLFGLTYDSPQQMYADMRARSENDPEFKQALIDLARDATSRGRNATIETSEILDRLERKN